MLKGDQISCHTKIHLIKILGLDICADTLVGDEMLKGISGGQKKRLTSVISLLQRPTPETYELFDDVLLLCEGQIVYQGPRQAALKFFSFMGFSCREQKNVADFLQEVVSKKDQEQYWAVPDCPYLHIPVVKFVEAFRSYRAGRSLSAELNVPFDKHYNHPAALSTSNYGVRRRELLKTNFD